MLLKIFKSTKTGADQIKQEASLVFLNFSWAS